MADTIPTTDKNSALAPATAGSDATTAMIDGRRLIVFAGCNYLGLSHHPEVVAAARDALGQFGLSASASRRTSGNTRIHEQLEQELAQHLGRPAGLLVPDGYTANLTAAQALAHDHSVALLDERAHLSLRDAARCAGLEIATYRHLDAMDAGVQADKHAARGVVVMTDGVFAADGAIASLDRLLDALPANGTRLLVDDCHGFCVLGEQGRGTPSHFGLDDDRLVVTTTLAKGLGCAGGVVFAEESLIDRARREASAFVCTTPTSPALAAGARTALSILISEPLRFERLRQNTERVRGVLLAAGYAPHTTHVPIFALDPQPGGAGRILSQCLREAGLFVPLVGYPGGPSPEYLRLSVCSEHSPDQIDQLGEALCAGPSGACARRA